MDFAGRITKLLIAGSATAGALALFSATAMAGTADYPSTGTFGVPNNTGQAGVPSQAFVPPGRTPVQSVQLTHVKPSFPVAGGGDLQFRLQSPSGTSIMALANSNCTTFPNTSDFTVTDSATNEVGYQPSHSAAALPSGSAASRTSHSRPSTASRAEELWTVTVVDIGTNPTQGTWNGWTLQINHANPTITRVPTPASR